MNVVLGLVADQFDKGLSKASKSLNRSAKNMQRVGKNLSLSVTAPLAAIGASSFKVAADFELSMAKVKAISGATGSEFENLEKQARDLGASTIFAASEVSGLQLELSKLGFEADDIQKATGSILSLAQATGEELGPTAETVAKTLNQFTLNADQSGRVADVMAAAFSSSALDLEKFSSSMANAGPVAANFGFSLEETTALLGILANSGIEGADAGTKLKMALSQVAQGGDDVQKVFRAVIAGNLSYTDAIDQLGKRAAILVPILGENASEIDKLTGALNNSTGAAKEMASIMDDTAAGSMAAMRSAVEAAQISLGTALAPVIQEVAGFVTDLAKRFSELDRDTQKNIVAFAGIAAAIGPVIIVIGKATTGFISFAKGISKATKFLAANPYLAVAAAVVTLGTALVSVAKRFRDVDGAAKALNETNNRALQITAKQRVEVNTLVAVAKDMNVEEERRADAIAELNRISPEHLGNLTLENINTAEATKSLAQFNEELLRRARLTAAQDRLVEIQREILDIQKELAEGPSIADRVLAFRDQFGAVANSVASAGAATRDLKEEEQKLLEIIKGSEEPLTQQTEDLNAATNAVNTYAKAAENAGEVLNRTNLTIDALPTLGPSTIDGPTIGAPSLQTDGIGGTDGIVASSSLIVDSLVEIGFTAEQQGQAIANFGNVLGETFEQLATDGNQAFQNLANAAREMTAQILGAFVAKAIGGVIAQSFSTLPPPVAAGVSAAFAGVARGLFKTLVPAFAQGGMVLGPQLALVGDNPSGREAIIPFERMGEFINMVGGGRSSNVNVSGRIDGTTIVLANERATRNRGR